MIHRSFKRGKSSIAKPSMGMAPGIPLQAWINNYVVCFVSGRCQSESSIEINNLSTVSSIDSIKSVSFYNLLTI